MKKLFLFLITILLITGCSTDVNNEKNDPGVEPTKPATKKERVGNNDVIVNLFYWNSCSHCHEEIEWLKYIDEKYENVSVNYYEITEYNDLDQKVRNALSIESTSVPLTIIGTDYYIGFGDSSKAKLMNSIENNASFESCNIVDKIANGEDFSSCYDISINE